MITHSPTFETLANAPVKTARVRFVDRDIGSPVDLNPDEDLEEVGYKSMGTFLGAGSKEITVKMIGDYTHIASKTYGVYLGLWNDATDTWEELRLGEFTATNSPEFDIEADRTTIKMRDSMFIAQETEYLLTDDVFPCTLEALAGAVCDQMGWVIMDSFDLLPNADYVITENLWSDIRNTTMRNVVVQIAEATGTTAIIAYDDITPAEDPVLTFRQYTVQPQVMTETNLKKFKTGEHYGKLNQVVLSRMPQGDNEVAGYTTDIDLNGVTSFSIVNNEIVDDDRVTTIAPLYDSLIDDAPFIEFDDLTLDTVGHGWYEIGDSWTVTVDGNDYIPFVTEHTMTINGGIKENVVSTIPNPEDVNRQIAGGIIKTLYDTTLKVDRQNHEIISLVSALEALDGETELNFTNITQTINNITTSVQTTGGGNMIRNSVGYGDQTLVSLNTENSFWVAAGSGTDPTLLAGTITGAGSSAWGTSGFTSSAVVFDSATMNANVSLTGVVDQADKNIAIGLTTLAMTDRDDLFAGLYFLSDGTVDIYSDGVQIEDNIAGYSAADTFEISYIDDRTYFFIDHELVYTMTGTTPLGYYVAGDFYSNGSISSLVVSYSKSTLSSWYYSGLDPTAAISTDSTNYGASSGSEITIINDSVLKQKITTTLNSVYSFSFIAKKSSTGTVIIRLYNEVDSYEVLLEDSTAYDWEEFSLEELVSSMNYFNVVVLADDVAEFIITDIMLNAGPLSQIWQQASGEILNTQVAIDNSGIRVRSSVYEGMESSMTPIEFAVRNNGTKVFEANPDGIGTSNIYNRGVLEFPNMRLIPITTGSNQGLAFVLKEE